MWRYRGGGGTGGGGNTGVGSGGDGGGAITKDPFTEGGSNGYDNDFPSVIEIPDVAPDAGTFYICPTNFVFASVTTHDLWQEAIATQVYCNIGYLDAETGEIRKRLVEIPEIHFGLPYYNIDDKLVYTKNEAT